MVGVKFTPFFWTTKESFFFFLRNINVVIMQLAHPSQPRDLFLPTLDQKLLLSGNEAFARGLFEADVRFFSTYPGTPVSEIGDLWEILHKINPIYHYDLAVNETVAFEEAVGAAWMGVRAAVSFKFLGMNLIADALHTVMYSGLDPKRKAGLIILCGSDPDITSSTNAEDVRMFSLHSKLPVLEPSSIQECCDWIRIAFDLSERWQIPILIHTTTLLNHSSGIVQTHPIIPSSKSDPNSNPFFVKHPEKYLNAIHWAQENQIQLYHKIHDVEILPVMDVKKMGLFEIQGVKDVSLTFCTKKKSQIIKNPMRCGILATGNGWTLSEELCQILGKDLPRCKIGISYPLNRSIFLEFIHSYNLDAVLILEETEPLIELQLSSILSDPDLPQNSVKVFGKNVFPREGSLSVDRILNSLGTLRSTVSGECWFQECQDKIVSFPAALKKITSNLPIREPTFCPGCAHRNVFYALRKAVDIYQRENGLETVFGGDIGCYTMGMSYPYHTLDWLICMGAGVGIANGVGRLVDPKKQQIVALIGDSTFFHSGIPPILNLAKQNIPVLVLILDNSFCAMTGDQISLSTPLEYAPDNRRVIRIQDLIHSMGDFPFFEMDGYSLKKMQTQFLSIFPVAGLKFVIVSAECALNKNRRLGLDKKYCAADPNQTKQHVVYSIADHCVQCNECYEKLGCTAIQSINGKYEIDESRCLKDACGSCQDICPNNAIWKTVINPHLHHRKNSSGGL